MLGGIGARRRDDAITEAGELLVAAGAVEPSYVDVHARAGAVGVDVHGQRAGDPARHQRGQVGSIRRTAISFVRYPDGVDWNGKQVKFVVGIAGAGDDHLALLGKIAEVFLDPEQVAALEAASTKAQILAILNSVSVS